MSLSDEMSKLENFGLTPVCGKGYNPRAQNFDPGLKYRRREFEQLLPGWLPENIVGYCSKIFSTFDKIDCNQTRSNINRSSNFTASIAANDLHSYQRCTSVQVYSKLLLVIKDLKFQTR